MSETFSDPIRATYRLQLHSEFDFDAAAAVVDYLRDLGVSHVYCSPYLQAAPGSLHGYDVVDHSAVNAELGGEKGHEWFCRRVTAAGLGQVVDVVPNHMAISGPENRWWWDVLENGPSSRYATYFDVDWSYSQQEGDNRILLPVLGDHYGRVVEAGQIRLERRGGSFVLRYFDHVWPVAPRSLAPVIARAGERCDSPDLGFVASALDYLPLPTATDRASTRRRHRDKEVLRVQLTRLFEEQPAARRAMDDEIELVNSDADRMDELLSRQNYRPAFWRVAGSDLSYRRFFDINDLVGMCVEDEEVFHAMHERILDWLNSGLVHGLRIDHPDGLRDPERYFQRLRDAAPHAWIVVEKILHPGERLRATWPVQGTTGYDFLNLLGGVFIDPAREGDFDRIYHGFIGADEPVTYHALLQEKKDQVVSELLGSDMNRLTALAMQLFQQHRRLRDFTRDDAWEALSVLVASFPVYRSYGRDHGVTKEDVRIIDDAVSVASARRADVDPELFAVLGSVLKREFGGSHVAELATRIQQLTGPVMAKGAEDTAFYCYTRFVALNEVGGDPGRFGTSLEEFHREMGRRAHEEPRAMLAGSTHDTKRSEDVRMRLAVLAEIPDAWEGFCDALREASGGFRATEVDPETEYLIYQTAVGAWPIDAERIGAYMQKAIKEAKRFTTWTRPDERYEAAVIGFARRLVDDPATRALVDQMAAGIRDAGRINSLSHTVIRLTAPGVPDVYQGTELWDLSLVDPDNRRPVDYDARRSLLAEIDRAAAGNTGTSAGNTGTWAEEALKHADEGGPKLLAVSRVLRARQQFPAAFGPDGEYEPLFAQGSRADHALAFCRGGTVVTVAVRLPHSLAGEWGETTLSLPDGTWQNCFTGERYSGGSVLMAELLGSFPVAVLTSITMDQTEPTGDSATTTTRTVKTTSEMS